MKALEQLIEDNPGPLAERARAEFEALEDLVDAVAEHRRRLASFPSTGRMKASSWRSWEGNKKLYAALEDCRAGRRADG